MRRADESTEDQTPGPEDSSQPEVSHTDVAQRADGAKPPQEDEEGSAAMPAPKRGPSGGKSPLVIFLILLAAIASIIVISIATQDQDEPRFTLPAEEPLSEPEAIHQLQELLDRRNQMFRERDLSALSNIYTTSSPVRPIAADEIDRLIEDDVLSRSRFEQLDVGLVTASFNELVFRERVRLKPRFVTEDGQDVTRDRRRIVQTVLWTLRQQEGAWKIHDSVIEASEPVGGNK